MTSNAHPEMSPARKDPLTVVLAVLLGSLLPIIAIGTGGLGAILLVVAPIALLAGAKNRTFWTAFFWGEVAVSVVVSVGAWLLW
ncbi:hypothetical protein G3I16_01800 [Streptomyces sp. SID11726]|nr:hypothetical protein [Streptomyces sp. SID11726]